MYRRQLRTYDGRIVARIEKDVLVKGLDGRILESQHMLRIPKAWAFDECIVEQAEDIGCNSIKVIATDTKRTYVADMDVFQLHKIKIDRGHNPQWGLTIGHWRIYEENGVNMLTEQATTIKSKSEQMKLF